MGERQREKRKTRGAERQRKSVWDSERQGWEEERGRPGQEGKEGVEG